MDEVKKKKSKEISEDEVKTEQDSIQKATDSHVSKIDEIINLKEKRAFNYLNDFFNKTTNSDLSDLEEKLTRKNIPTHIAIIMDGNKMGKKIQ